MLPRPTRQDLDLYLKMIDKEIRGGKTRFGFNEGHAVGSKERIELNRMAEYAIFRTYNDTDQRFESTLNNK